VSLFREDNKTEAATPKRRAKVRSEGSVAKSQDLTAAVTLLTAAVALMWLGSGMTGRLSELTRVLLANCGTHELTEGELRPQLAQGMAAIALILGPFFAAIMALGVATNIAQVGFKITTKAAMPKFSRINPLSGLQRLFSPGSVVELIKSIVKLLIVGLVVYFAIRDNLPRLFDLSHVGVEALADEAGHVLLHILLISAISLLILGLADFAYHKYEYEESLKMTKEEVTEESKESEGDPKVRSKVREIMIKSSLRRMMKKVPEADVVITNPIHLAVALKYDRAKGAAPIVVAKGARKVAERIKLIAAEHGVPIIENKPLAQALFKAVEIGQEIPFELYKAVAEILAYVYRIKKKYFGVA
jgi:flagellar biosynthetic protein FlhB